jgi:hypothetical protein
MPRAEFAVVPPALGGAYPELDRLARQYGDLYREADVDAHRTTLRGVERNELRV